MVLKAVMDKIPKKSEIRKYAILSQPINLTFLEDEIFQLFSYLYGSKVPKWNFAHILLWKKAKNIRKTPKNTLFTANWLRTTLLNDTVCNISRFQKYSIQTILRFNNVVSNFSIWVPSPSCECKPMSTLLECKGGCMAQCSRFPPLESNTRVTLVTWVRVSYSSESIVVTTILPIIAWLWIWNIL